MNEFSSQTIGVGIFVIGTFVSLGKLLEKIRDNTEKITILFNRIENLEEERVEVEVLNVKLINLESKLIEFKIDVKAGLEEVKNLIRTRSDRLDMANERNKVGN